MHWTEYISPIGIPIIAAIAAWIAFRQFQIARNKLKLDLFDKRMEVYTAVRESKPGMVDTLYCFEIRVTNVEKAITARRGKC